MISQLTSSSFDQLLLSPPAPPSAPTTVTTQPKNGDCISNNESDGCAATVMHSSGGPIITTINGDKQRKRKRSSASNDHGGTNNNNINDTIGNDGGGGAALSAPSSSASAQGDGASPKLAGVEQQLVASSPSLFLQHALRHNAIDGTATTGQTGEEQQQGTGIATMDFFEAHKAFQKLSNQLGTGLSAADSVPFLPTMAQPAGGMNNNPFVQQLATLSPFLMALQHQSQQFMQAHQNQFDAATFLSIPSNNNSSENLFQQIASSPMGYVKDEEEEEEEEEDEERSNSGQNQAMGEPEDLSLKSEGRSSVAHHNGNCSSHNRNGTPNWSYEEQFKQLYELSPTDLNRKEWLDDWLEFMRQHGKPVTRIPIMAKQVLDLYELYRLVVHHGGLVEVINKKLWREIAKGLNLPTSITSAAFTLRTQYDKYLYDYECKIHKFSDRAALEAAIDANKREGRRNPPPPGAAGVTSNSAGATPAGAQHHNGSNNHNNNSHHQHNYSGGRHSSANSAEAQQQRHMQQQQMRWFEQMFGTAPPPPPMVAAAFFGKHLLSFGGGTATDGMATMARATTEEESAHQNGDNSSRAPSVAQPPSQFAGVAAMPFQFLLQNGEENQRQQFDSIFPKIELANGRSSSSPQTLAQRQNEANAETGKCQQHQDGTAASSSSTSSSNFATSSANQQQRQSPADAALTEKRRKVSDQGPHSASVGRAPSINVPKNNAIACGDGTSVASPLGPFGDLLKNALRFNIKVNNGEESKNATDGNSSAGNLPPATTATFSGNDPSSMVVSMEINGVQYQGVLFAMPTAESETAEVLTERQNRGNKN